MLWSINGSPLSHSLANGAVGAKSLTFSPDGKILASGTLGKIELWNTTTYEPLGQPLVNDAIGGEIAFSPDGKALASVAEFGDAVIIWNLTIKSPKVYNDSLYTLNSVNGVTFSPDGKRLAVSYGTLSLPKNVKTGVTVVDVATGEKIAGLYGNDQEKWFGLAYSPDGRIIASGGCSDSSDTGYGVNQCYQGKVYLSDVAANQLMGQPLAGHTNWVTSVIFSPDGKLLASGSLDESIRLWDVSAEKQSGQPLIGHRKGVESLAFTPDGKILASGGEDGSIILWNVATHQQLAHALSGHISAVNSLAFTPDGKTLASSSDDTILLWNINLESWATLACRIANRNLTREEWIQYLGDQPYQKTCVDVLPSSTP